MFENLTDRLTNTFRALTGQSHLTEENIQQAIRDIRLSLLEADVALPVVKTVIETIKQKAIGQSVDPHLKPDQAFTKLVKDELIEILGATYSELNFKTEPPAVILMAGLQGSGKTTTTAKLAHFLQDTEKKKIMVVSVDTYRPAAIDQLNHLAQKLAIPFYPTDPTEKPEVTARKALESAKKQFIEVLIVDTAGRLHVDEHMMQEIQTIHQVLNPIETLFVVDAMTGQDAANTAKAFNEALPITGVVLTKTDGDARGGAALSIRSITGKPIKFMGTSENMQGLEPFHPERIASRILGMGDILSLIEEVERKADKSKAEKLAKKIKKGQGFDLEDFREQLLQMKNIGGIGGMMSKLPGLGQMPAQASGQMNDKVLIRTTAIIDSMTIKERRNPKIIIGSRKRRIANGSGTSIPEVNRVLKQYEQMQKMMKKFSKPGALKNMVRGLGGIPGLKNMLPGDLLK